MGGNYPDSIDIPAGMLDMIFAEDSEWYNELIDYLVNETDYEYLNDDEIIELGLTVPDGAYGDAFFRDDAGNVYEGELNGPKNPDGSQRYSFNKISISET
jgi:hypothetical protein